MQTKSNIQLIREFNEKKDSFKSRINELTDKYLVEDSIFILNGLNNLTEITKGYFCILEESDNFDKIVNNMCMGESLRIINNDKFQRGNVYMKLSEANGENVLNIENGNIITN